MGALLIKNWKYVAMALLLAALVGSTGYIKLLKSQKETLEVNIDGLKDRLQISQDSVKALQSSIDEQNKAIQELKSFADARELAAQIAIQEARTAAEEARRRASNILNVQKPVGVSSCDAANALINKEIENAINNAN